MFALNSRLRECTLGVVRGRRFYSCSQALLSQRFPADLASKRVLLLSQQASTYVDGERWIEAEQTISTLFQLCGVKTGLKTAVEAELLAEEQRLAEEKLAKEASTKAEAEEASKVKSGGRSKPKSYNLRGVMGHASTRMDADERKRKSEEEKQAREQSWVPLPLEEFRQRRREELADICAADVRRMAEGRSALRLPAPTPEHEPLTAPSDDHIRGFLGRHLYILGFAQHSLGKRRLAEAHYRRGIACLAPLGAEYTSELALAKLNFAELLAALNKIPEAETVAVQAVELLKGSFGVKSEWYGAAKSNLGTYLCAQSKYEEAKEVAFEALAVLHDTLGADNELTQSALQNCMAVLKETDPAALADFKKEWASKGQHDLDEMRKKGIGASDEQIADAVDRFKAGVEAKTLDPRGWMKDLSFSKEELNSFLAHQASVGEPVDADQAYAVARELAAMSGVDADDVTEAQTQETADADVEKAFQDTISGGSSDAMPIEIDLEALDRHSDVEGGDEQLQRDMWVAEQHADALEAEDGRRRKPEKGGSV